MTNISNQDWEKQLRLYETANEFGINSFDTAPHYLDGMSEKFLGELLSRIQREKVFVSSKVFYNHKESGSYTGLSKEHIIKTVDASLRNLNTEYIDVLYFHRFDKGLNLHESIKTVSELIKEGKVKSWGVCGFNEGQVVDAYHIGNIYGIELKYVQHAYNLFNRHIEKGLNEIFLNKNIKVFSYYALSQGILTGKYNSSKFIDSRANDEFFKQFMWDLNEEKIEVCRSYIKLCESYDLSPITVAYNWCLRNQNVASVITNFRDFKQLNTNINAMNSTYNSEINSNLEQLFKNEPVDQYTGLKFGINERRL